jgi:two-component sensor histidine kinase
VLTAAKQAVLARGETQQVEIEITGDRGPRWYNVTVRPHYEQGRAVGTVAAFIDITDSKVQEEHLRIVLKELAHRSKNLLSVIQGIARQTAESASTTPEFLSRFNGRIFSLSRAHDVLTDADWRGARIFDLVKSQIALYAEDRMASVVTEGENSYLRPNAAQYLGLALHELTTNAIKYGALSRDDGVVLVRFEKSPGTGGAHRFSWQETSSAETREPSGRSFGLLMLTDVVPLSVSGAALLTFPPEGVRYELDIPQGQLLP